MTIDLDCKKIINILIQEHNCFFKITHSKFIVMESKKTRFENLTRTISLTDPTEFHIYFKDILINITQLNFD